MHVELVIFLLEAVHQYYESWRCVLLTDKKPERVDTAMKLGRKLELLNENDKYVFNCYLICVVDLCIAYFAAI